ncbi:MAG: TonB-dependent receptor [Sphingobacteriales bacterium]|nr:TonB-dependent receptor [Sphingobacteriales bacterium]
MIPSHLLRVILLLLISIRLSAQTPVIFGVVNDGATKLPLPGAVVGWSGTDQFTTTNDSGFFRMESSRLEEGCLVVQLLGYSTDSLCFGKEQLNSNREIVFSLQAGKNLKEAEVVSRRQTTEMSTLQIRGVETLNEGELLKAACCNLSESFETNPSVDVNYSDALTGTKEIQLLGLSGIYTLLLGEAIPTMRVLAAPFGLTAIPGSWMESIQISKGAGSVSTGYEGLTGQINVEFRKPLKPQPLVHLNLYADAFGRGEVNSIYSKPLRGNWNYMLMTHFSGMQREWDDNKDGFLDMPKYRQANVYNRLHFNVRNRYEGQLGIKAFAEERNGGQLNFDETRDRSTYDKYGIRIRLSRVEAYAKTGLIFPDEPYRSAGIQISTALHSQDAFFGRQDYSGTQTSVYVNGIYMGVFTTTDHKFKTGLDFRMDKLNERVNDSAFSRTEWIPGAYFEYTFGCESRPFGAIAGLRADLHNMFGLMVTPRLNLKYNFSDDAILRASAGSARRYPNPYADNIGLFTSAKSLKVLEAPRLEHAWNAGLSFTNRFYVGGREGSVVADLFRTVFQNQWVSDQFSSKEFVYYYNLSGGSTANSAQLVVNYELVPGLQLRLAGRMDDVRVDYIEFKDIAKPLLSRYKSLVNIAWTSRAERWRADATWQWESPKNLPQAAGELLVAPEKSPEVQTVMAQLTRVFSQWEMYIGSENLFGFTQANPILGADNPFGATFDANRIWGPVMGRRVYLGIRWNIGKPVKSESQ